MNPIRLAFSAAPVLLVAVASALACKGGDPAPVDPCTAALCDRNATCANVEGAPVCTCHAGYVGDGVSCVPELAVQATLLASGADHSCEIRGDGTLWCWGGNTLGALGDGSSTTRETPVRVRDRPHVRHRRGGRRLLLGVQRRW